MELAVIFCTAMVPEKGEWPVIAKGFYNIRSILLILLENIIDASWRSHRNTWPRVYPLFRREVLRSRIGREWMTSLGGFMHTLPRGGIYTVLYKVRLDITPREDMTTE